MNYIVRNAQMKDYHFFEQVKEIKAEKSWMALNFK